MAMDESFVMPGDKLGVEEEFVASDNTFVDDDGSIRSSIIGSVSKSDGKISVHNPQHEIERIKMGMTVVGTITDDLRTVMFVKIDNIKSKGKEFLATKDGKIVAPRDRGPPRGRDFGDRRGGEGDERRPTPQEPKSKQANVGDVVLATVLEEEQDTFLLGIRSREMGVVSSNCEMCDTHMDFDEKMMALVCPECKHKQVRKVSAFYNKPEAIKEFLMINE